MVAAEAFAHALEREREQEHDRSRNGEATAEPALEREKREDGWDTEAAERHVDLLGSVYQTAVAGWELVKIPEAQRDAFPANVGQKAGDESEDAGRDDDNFHLLHGTDADSKRRTVDKLAT